MAIRPALRPQRARATGRCIVLTGECPPGPNRPEEPGSEIDTAWLDDRIFLLPLWRALRSQVTGPAALRTANNEPSRRRVAETGFEMPLCNRMISGQMMGGAQHRFSERYIVVIPGF